MGDSRSCAGGDFARGSESPPRSRNTSQGDTSATGSISICRKRPKGRLPVVVWIHGGAWMAGSKDDCPAVPFVTQGLRGGEHQLPPEPTRPLSRPNRGLQGRHPLAAGQCRQISSRSRAHRRLGRVGRRPSGRAAGHDGRREGIGGTRRQSRPIEPRAVRPRLVRANGFDLDGQGGRPARFAGGSADRRPGAGEQGEGPQGQPADVRQ